ncbi:MAG TPA: hypothetical protein VF865_09205 [Acidobacteriaceae bacterium]
MKQRRQHVVGLASACLFALAGCAVNPIAPVSAGPTFQPPGGMPLLYVAEGPFPATMASILEYPTGSSGTVSPINTVGPFPGVINDIAVDTSGNIYVVTGSDIREYAADATGAAVPIRAIVPAPSAGVLIDNIQGLAVDSSGNIYVSLFYSEVVVFNSSANGTAFPSRYIFGNLTKLHIPGVLTTDSAGNLYAGNDPGGTVVLGPAANGNTPADRFLNVTTCCLATDAAANLYTGLHNPTNPSSYKPGDPTTDMGTGVAVFSPTASGTDAPIRTIATGFDNLIGIALDSPGNIYVATNGTIHSVNGSIVTTPGVPMILKFSSTASGQDPPLITFTPSGWSGHGGIAIH